MNEVNMEQIWQQHLEKAVQQTWDGTVFSGFNATVDVIVHLQPKSIKNFMESNPDLDVDKIRQISLDSLEAINTREEFVAVLIDSLRDGKSVFLVIENPELFGWLEKQFPEAKDRLGGQAGIMANQMASLKARSVLYSPILSPRQANVLDQNVLFPVLNTSKLELKPITNAVRPGDPTRSPWVFEYGKGELFDFGFEQIVTPRANRTIVVSRPRGLGMNFRPELNSYLESLGAQCDVGFLAGYHLGGPFPEDFEATREYFKESLEALKRLRKGNPNLKMHLEYVPMKEAALEKEMLSTITKGVDSFGINENEIRRVLTLFGHEELAKEVTENERAYSLYKAAYALKKELNVERIHIHNLGYYVIVLDKPYPYPVEQVRQGCLFGSSVNSRKALHGGFVTLEEVPQATQIPLSSVGLEQLRAFAKEVAEKEQPLTGLDDMTTTGILEFADHYVVVVPTQIVPNPVITVGMGDTISSSSYATEVIGSN